MGFFLGSDFADLFLRLSKKKKDFFFVFVFRFPVFGIGLFIIHLQWLVSEPDTWLEGDF